MFPGQKVVRPVTLQSDLVSVTEQRVNDWTRLQMSLQRHMCSILGTAQHEQAWQAGLE